MKTTAKITKNNFVKIIEEWLIVLIAMLILLVIAISAASARTIIAPLNRDTYRVTSKISNAVPVGISSPIVEDERN